jgi:RHS repeat-associated protein
VRSYVVDDEDSIVRFTIPAGEPDAGTYLVNWNGHGDALNLLRVNGDGTTTLANSFTYDSWGRPTVATHNGVANLDFRFLYVGQFDVQWDNFFGLGLHYMHARHYSPTLGRFIQADPSELDDALYAYGDNNPITEVDPDGELPVLLVAAAFFVLRVAVVAAPAAAGAASTVQRGAPYAQRWAPVAQRAAAYARHTTTHVQRARDAVSNFARRRGADPRLREGHDRRIADFHRYRNRWENRHLGPPPRPPFRAPRWCTRTPLRKVACGAAVLGTGVAVGSGVRHYQEYRRDIPARPRHPSVTRPTSSRNSRYL